MEDLIKFCAVYLIVIPILLTIYLVSRQDSKHRKEYIYLLVLAGILALVLATLAGRLFENPRPYISDGVSPLFHTGDDNGFPSSHTLLAGLLAFTATIYSRKIGVTLLAIAIIIGWARVASGVHHGVDIIGGLIISGLSVWVTASLFRLRNKQLKKELPKKHNKQE